MSSAFEKRVETFTETLIICFGYKPKEARGLASEAMDNLDRYVNLQETMIKRLIESRKK
jgi:hypothetical protein